MINSNLTQDQIGAIRQGIELGKILTKDHPEIADLYEQGDTLSTIAEELNIQLTYGVGKRVAKSGIHKAIAGHGGSFNLRQYDGLIPDIKERKRLMREHHQECGYRLHEEGIGIHGRTPEQTSEAGRKGGTIAGRKIYEKSIGVHGRTPEQMRKDGRKSAIVMGQTPWTRKEDEFDDNIYCAIDEIVFAYNLSQKPEYQWAKGCNKGQTNNKKIAEIINKLYHNREEIRNSKTIQVYLSKYRKSLEERVD
tara:strand:+ start:9068 stop:9817 length:750 start_codon:yes stop_codon:yes gene_type:complete